MPEPRVETFRVVASNGGTLNLVKVALNERDNEPLDVKVEKRRQEAELKRQQWSYNYFDHTEALKIVPCDWLGNPIPQHFRHADNEQVDA